MALLYSVKSRHIKNIIAGKKKAELRRNLPADIRKSLDNHNGNEAVSYAYFYCNKDDNTYEHSGTVPCGAGICGYEEVSKDSSRAELERYSQLLCISVEEILNYVDKKKAYVIMLTSPDIYEPVKKLNEFTKCICPEYPYCPCCRLGGESVAEWVETREDLGEPGATSWYCINFIKTPPRSYYDNVELEENLR